MWKKSIVYRSKNKEDWEKAQALLNGAGIESWPFAAQESPIPGCGAKVDPRSFLNKNPVPDKVCRIEVALADQEKAHSVLDGQVQPVRSYGYSI